METTEGCNYVDPSGNLFSGVHFIVNTRSCLDSCVQVTFVADYSCHVHKDHQNITGGATAVFTITTEVQPVQLHILHEYKLAKVKDLTLKVSMHYYQYIYLLL